MTTLVIEGGDRWRVQQREEERATMAGYIARVGDSPGRCADCAFREGSEASQSRLVLRCVEMCLTSYGHNKFCCHHGDDPGRECAGYAALIRSFTGEAIR